MRSFSWFAGDSSQSLLAISAVAFCEVRGLIRGLLRFKEVYRIACADHWFFCNRVVRLAEVVAVAVRDLAESLQSLYAIAADSSWLLVRAHGIFAIASAICRIPRGLILRLVEFIAIACEVADT
jgi:hypothetical protein